MPEATARVDALLADGVIFDHVEAASTALRSHDLIVAVTVGADGATGIIVQDRAAFVAAFDGKRPSFWEKIQQTAYAPGFRVCFWLVIKFADGKAEVCRIRAVRRGQARA